MTTLTSPITGSAQANLTSPTYTHVADVAPDVNGRQVAVTALGGTQTGVVAHSISSPFTVNIVRPKVPKVLPAANPVTGVIRNFPKNTTKVITRKGVIPLAGQSPQLCIITTTVDVPAGADTADPVSLQAALSCHIGALTQASSALGTTVISGVL